MASTDVSSGGLRTRLLSGLYYGGLLTVLVVTLLGALDTFLPAGVARRVGFNSEGYLLALLFAAWIQVVRPRLRRSRHEWRVVSGAAVASVALGVHLYLSDYPSRVKTLNESFVAAGVVLVYLHLRRPLPRLVAPGLATVVLLTMVFGQSLTLVTRLAESLAVLLLVPLALDVVDRGILDETARTSTPLRAGWYALLVLVPVVSSLLFHGGYAGAGQEAVRYAVRLHEAFVAVLLIELFLAVCLGRRGAGSRHASSGAAPAAGRDAASMST